MKIDPFYAINQNEKDFDIEEYVLDNKKLDTLIENMIVDSKALDSSISDSNSQINQSQNSLIEEDFMNNDVDLH